MNQSELITRMLALYDQIENPRHCHVRAGKILLSHHPDPNDPNDMHPLKGQPIRFSRTAAEAIVGRNRGFMIEEI